MIGKILNKNIASFEKQSTAIYIGRPSKWGNKFIIGKDGNREQVVAKYRAYLWSNTKLMAELVELDGKNLLCFCSPQQCHGDVLKAARNWQLQQKE